MKLKQTIKDKKLVKTENNRLTGLSPKESKSINLFIDSLLDEDNCQLIFRGEKIKYAYDKSGVNEYYSDKSEEYKFGKHGNSIFYIGAKADSYLFKIEDVNFPIDLNNTEKELFTSIFNEFKKSKDHSTLKNESKFREYFDKPSSDFIEKILNLNALERIVVKYYYLWLLHVIGDTEYKRYSNFLSTSKDYEVAFRFSNQEIVYVGWIPRPIKIRSVYLGYLIQSRKRIESLGLPTYSDEPYPDENEISLIGGLFPHYVLGIYHVRKKLLLVNEYLLKDDMVEIINSGLSEIIIKHGIGIDQSDFENSEFLKISGYKRHLTHIKGKGYSDHE